jgi:hypothetical protein
MKTLFCLMLASPVLALAQGNYPFCQILDRVDAPPWEVHGGYLTSADVDEEGGDDFGILGVEGGGGLAYFQTGYGDIDLTGSYEVQAFTADGGIGLPDHLGAVALNGAYIWRNPDGRAVKVTASPGFRSDLEEMTSEAFYIPISFSVIRSFSPVLSGYIGVAVYPWYEQYFDPRFGIRWAIHESLLLDLMYPESKLSLSPEDGWDMYAGLRINNMPQWTIEDDRESIMIDETRAYVGVNHPVTSELRMMYQVGLVFNRSVDFAKEQEESNVDDAFYVRVGVGGAL